LDPAQPLSGPLLGGFLPGIGKPLALIRELFTTICGVVALVGDAVSLIGDPLALVGKLLAGVGRVLELVHQPFALIADPRERRRVSVPSSGMTLVTQPGSLLLQVHIIGCEFRRPALNLRAEALDLDPANVIVLPECGGAQPLQIGSVRFELSKRTL
jgi:hypothetical protein